MTTADPYDWGISADLLDSLRAAEATIERVRRLAEDLQRDAELLGEIGVDEAQALSKCTHIDATAIFRALGAVGSERAPRPAVITGPVNCICTWPRVRNEDGGLRRWDPREGDR